MLRRLNGMSRSTIARPSLLFASALALGACSDPADTAAEDPVAANPAAPVGAAEPQTQPGITPGPTPTTPPPPVGAQATPTEQPIPSTGQQGPLTGAPPTGSQPVEGQ